MNDEPISLRLFEDNEIDISLSLEGSDPELREPELRFVLVDLENKDVSWLFRPKRNLEEGLVNVKIPKGPYAMIKDKTMQGTLEIIIGERYFSPASFLIKFVSPVSIKAVPTLQKESHTPFTVKAQINPVVVSKKR